MDGQDDDVIHAQDGEVDRIDCGSGTDTVTADRNDILVDCEKVTFRPSGPSAASVATRKLNANRKRTKAPVALSCSDAATRCTGRITVTTGKGKRRTLLARGRYSLAAGASGKVRLTLTEAGNQVALRRHDGLIHAFVNTTGVGRTGREALLEACGALRMGVGAGLAPR